MKTEIKVPSVGESITEATISEWSKKDGEAVKRDDVLLVLETDKASVEVVAEAAGVLKVAVPAGTVVKVGSVVGAIEPGSGAVATPPAPAAKPSSPPPAAKPSAPPAGLSANGGTTSTHSEVLSPAVRRIVSETSIDPASVTGTGKGGRLTKADVLTTLPATTKQETPPLPMAQRMFDDEIKREPMTMIRRRIAERLLEAQNTSAILTTFNEIDMSAVNDLRARYKDKFKEKYGINFGFMGLFVKASIEALRAFPKVNAFIDGNDIVYHNYYNVGIAVGTERGLIVPVIRHAEKLSLAEIELSIRHYATKARDGKITVDDLNGGTFTITNGGVYGSLMSTPILNPPQSGILGMHKIEERPVVVNGHVVVRPMMYVALSYDHRIIDGSESVSFLVRVKECLEDPSRILLEI